MNHFRSAHDGFRRGFFAPESKAAAYQLARLHLLSGTDPSVDAQEKERLLFQAAVYFAELASSSPNNEENTAYYYFGLAGLSYIYDYYVRNNARLASENPYDYDERTMEYLDEAQTYQDFENDSALETALFFYALGNLHTFVGNSDRAEVAYNQSAGQFAIAEKDINQTDDSIPIEKTLLKKAKHQSQLLALRPSIYRKKLISNLDDCMDYLEEDDLISTELCIAQIHFFLGHNEQAADLYDAVINTPGISQIEEQIVYQFAAENAYHYGRDLLAHNQPEAAYDQFLTAREFVSKYEEAAGISEEQIKRVHGVLSENHFYKQAAALPMMDLMITGRLIGHDGTGLHDVQIEINGEPIELDNELVQTDADGRFVIEDLTTIPLDPLILDFVKADGKPVVRYSLNIEPGKANYDLEITLPDSVIDAYGDGLLLGSIEPLEPARFKIADEDFNHIYRLDGQGGSEIDIDIKSWLRIDSSMSTAERINAPIPSEYELELWDDDNNPLADSSHGRLRNIVLPKTGIYYIVVRNPNPWMRDHDYSLVLSKKENYLRSISVVELADAVHFVGINKPASFETAHWAVQYAHSLDPTNELYKNLTSADETKMKFIVSVVDLEGESVPKAKLFEGDEEIGETNKFGQREIEQNMFPLGIYTITAQKTISDTEHSATEPIDLEPSTLEYPLTLYLIPKNLDSELQGFINQAQSAALSGDSETAARLFEVSVPFVIKTKDANLNNSICRGGSLEGIADTVLPACEKAVELAPTQGRILDSRGLARALNGDYDGAIEDFQFYVEWVQNTPEAGIFSDRALQREQWIRSLEQGQNPFDEATLESIRGQ